MLFEPVPQKIDFPRDERKILAFWKKAGIFEKSLALRAGGPRFIFFEGPPTANGTPHNGHVLTRVIKDVFPRYKTMRGYQVPRKAGWDTHGLPVEVEVEKELGIHGKAEIEAYGVEAFTRKCIESVFRYTDVWETLTERIGFWVDLDEAYVTFHQSYVESVWWALSTLFRKGLLYRGHKVVWWWPQGGTALSAGEVGQGYKQVDDPSITLRFGLLDEPGTHFLAWTTTPWTLPSNCALAVNPKLDYAFARRGDEVLVLAADLLDSVLGEGTYAVDRTVRGHELVGTRYQPLFDYARPESGRLHEVVPGDYVSLKAGAGEAGTGVVHVAPAFGEEDYAVARQNGIGMLQLLRPDGTFPPEVSDFAGRFCKEADKDIIRHLKGRGLVFAHATSRHDYPFCWRAMSDPLIQYARPAWFIRTTEVIDRARANNQRIDWHPKHIRDGRFGDFLDHNVDWALSRERYWGTPLPIWVCEGCEASEAFASTAEILERNPEAFGAFEAVQAEDPALSPHLRVHKPWIDSVTVPCRACSGTMRRVPDVVDCWFDSGCMPFAQWGYPHTGRMAFEGSWPADFISEAIDQTRGWFYSLLMISTLLFEDADPPHPFRSCIVLGHVTDQKGKKESKSRGNYTPPDEILDRDGADAMRWYFYAANPPHNNTRYSAAAVRQGQQEFLVKLRNVYAFFVIYANIDGFDPRESPHRPVRERGLLDRWLLSEVEITVRDVTAAMDRFAVYEAAQRLIRLIDALSNWWLRRSRERFWAPADKATGKWDAYHTLYEALTTLSRLAAPFVPFLADLIHQNLGRRPHPEAPESVHLCDWPELHPARIDQRLSEDMQAVRDIVSLGLATRAHHRIKVRQPLARAEVILGQPEMGSRVKPYLGLIAEELNVKRVDLSQDAGGRVRYTVKPNYRALGPIFGKRMPEVRAAVDAGDPDALRRQLQGEGAVELTLSDGTPVRLNGEQLQVSVEAEEGYAAAGATVGVVVLETTMTESLRAEGTARDLISRIQAARKELDLAYTARISVHLNGDAAALAAARAWTEVIASETLADEVLVGHPSPEGGNRIEVEVGEGLVEIRVAPTS